jgi:hypothetical protein
MNSLEKKIHQEIDADKDLYCSETHRNSISQHRTRDNVQLEELHRPKRKMRQNAVITYIFYNYVSGNSLNVLL